MLLLGRPVCLPHQKALRTSLSMQGLLEMELKVKQKGTFICKEQLKAIFIHDFLYISEKGILGLTSQENHLSLQLNL